MSRSGSEAVLLITGFPSIYARKMIEHVLEEEPMTFLYLLVENSHVFEAQALLASRTAAERDRITILEGSPTSIDFGLSGAEFRQVTREVTRIHHMVYSTDPRLDRKQAEALHVGSTVEALEVARAASSLGCLMLHSTALVSGDRNGTIYEGDLDEGQSFPSDLIEARMRAEAVLRKAMRQVPIAVVRPTSIVGDMVPAPVEPRPAHLPPLPTTTARLSGIYLLVLLLIAAPADLAVPLPGASGDIPLNIVPIDFVVRAANAISKHPMALGRTFHLADPRPPTMRRVVELVGKVSRQKAARGYVPSDLAKTLLRTPGIEQFVRSPRGFWEQLMTPVRYDTRNTDAALAGTGIECPPFESYVEELVAAVEEYLRGGRERRAARVEAEVDDPLS